MSCESSRDLRTNQSSRAAPQISSIAEPPTLLGERATRILFLDPTPFPNLPSFGEDKLRLRVGFYVAICLLGVCAPRIPRPPSENQLRDPTRLYWCSCTPPPPSDIFDLAQLWSIGTRFGSACPLGLGWSTPDFAGEGETLGKLLGRRAPCSLPVLERYTLARSHA